MLRKNVKSFFYNRLYAQNLYLKAYCCSFIVVQKGLFLEVQSDRRKTAQKRHSSVEVWRKIMLLDRDMQNRQEMRSQTAADEDTEMSDEL